MTSNKGGDVKISANTSICLKQTKKNSFLVFVLCQIDRKWVGKYVPGTIFRYSKENMKASAGYRIGKRAAISSRVMTVPQIMPVMSHGSWRYMSEWSKLRFSPRLRKRMCR